MHRQNVSVDHSPYKVFLLVLLLSIYLAIPAVAQSSPTNSKLNNIEEKIFHHKYSSDPDEERLSRIEEFIFRKDFSKGTTTERISKITSALNLEEEQEKPEVNKNLIAPEAIKLDELQEKIEIKEPIVIEQSNNTEDSGVIGTISKIERQIFGKSHDELPFQTRVEALEDSLLSGLEKFKAKRRPLLDRVNYLIQKSGLNVRPSYPPQPIQPKEQYQYQAPPSIQEQITEPNIQQKQPSNPPTYSIDPNSGFLIDTETGEFAKDAFGNPITVGRQGVNPIQEPYNPFGQFANPYGNQYGSTGSPQPLPPEFYLNTGMIDDF